MTPVVSSHSPYSREFYAQYQDRSQASAAEVLPLVLKRVRPQSVVDLGCGVGTWLAAARENGVAEILGVDGPWVKQDALLIPGACFTVRDASHPLDLGRTFDLAMSLEVAEHIPPESADTFVDNLTKLSSVILFSAAVPLQGGMSHVNEQWPEYWARRFAARGYTAVDCLRQPLGANPRVEFWYAQNAFLYVRNERLESFGFTASEIVGEHPAAWVHRELYLKIVEKYERTRELANPVNIPLRKAVSTVFIAARRVLFGK